MGSFLDDIAESAQGVHDFTIGVLKDPVGTITGTAGIKAGMDTQSEAFERATGITKEMYEQTKKDLLLMIAPALERYNQSINDSIEEIRSGRNDVISTFNNSTDRAYQMLTDSGANAKKIMMGADSRRSGTPRSTFEQEYQRTRGQPIGGYQQPQGTFRRAIGAGIRGKPREYDYIEDPKPQPQDYGQSGGYIKEDRLEPENFQTGGGRPLYGGGTIPQTQPQQQQEQEQPPQPNELEQIINAISGGSVSTDTNRPSAIMPTDRGGYQPPPGQIGYGPAREALESGYGRATGFLERGIGTAREDIYKGLEGALGRTGKGLEEFRPYSDVGRSAIDREGALSGALGPERQQEAIDSYIESPGQEYLRKQQEKALLRSSAAIGGLGGGTVRTALQKQAKDIASTQQQQYLENLRSLATRGQGAAGARAGILGQEAGLITQAESNRADLARQLGLTQADLARMSAQDLSSLAERAGINISNIEQQTGLQKSALLQALGQNVAGTQGAASTNIANLISQGGAGGLSAGQNIAQILANLTTGQGTNLANIAIGQGQGQAAGQAAIGQSQSNFIQTILSLAALGG